MNIVVSLRFQKFFPIPPSSGLYSEPYIRFGGENLHVRRKRGEEEYFPSQQKTRKLLRMELPGTINGFLLAGKKRNETRNRGNGKGLKLY
jgi:hypothetical protein